MTITTNPTMNAIPAGDDGFVTSFPDSLTDIGTAVGTSLIIIASKSLLGFLGDLRPEVNIDWTFLMIFSSIAIVGILVGAMLSKKISGDKLKPAFGWFVLIMGVYIIIDQLLK
jgi:uncharacterized membrane protein YfcA